MALPICYRWAVGQTGVDPVHGGSGVTVVTTTRASDTRNLNPLAAAAGGAALGAAGGAMAGDAGMGAAVGAGVGAIASILNQPPRPNQQSIVTAPTNNAADYQRAFATCLAGRGYVVG